MRRGRKEIDDESLRHSQVEEKNERKKIWKLTKRLRESPFRSMIGNGWNLRSKTMTGRCCRSCRRCRCRSCSYRSDSKQQAVVHLLTLTLFGRLAVSLQGYKRKRPPDCVLFRRDRTYANDWSKDIFQFSTRGFRFKKKLKFNNRKNITANYIINLNWIE